MSAFGPWAEEGRWFRGNLHTHTTNSDGRLSPEDTIVLYKQAGYEFAAITDHDKFTDATALSDARFALLRGVEVSAPHPQKGPSYHILALGIDRELSQEERASAPQALAAVAEKGGIAFACHPYWSAHTINDLLPLERILGIEVFNTTCQLEIGRGFSNVHWDEGLGLGRRWTAVAVDDFHGRGDHGGGWIVLKARKLSEKEILDSLRRGSFYSSRGPRILSLDVEGRTITVETSSVASIHFVCDDSLGHAVHAQPGRVISFARWEVHRNARYTRIECTDWLGKQAWSNPIFFE
jgi:hypothetical protein